MRAENRPLAVRTVGRQRHIGPTVPCLLQNVIEEAFLTEDCPATLMCSTWLVAEDLLAANDARRLSVTWPSGG